MFGAPFFFDIDAGVTMSILSSGEILPCCILLVLKTTGFSLFALTEAGAIVVTVLLFSIVLTGVWKDSLVGLRVFKDLACKGIFEDTLSFVAFAVDSFTPVVSFVNDFKLFLDVEAELGIR